MREEQSGGLNRKRHKRGWLHVKHGWSTLLSDPALCLIVSLSCLLIKSFLNDLSVNSHSYVLCLCKCCKDEVPAARGTTASGFGASSWSHTRSVGTPGLWCQLLEPVGSLCHALGWAGIWAPATWWWYVSWKWVGQAGAGSVRGSAPAAGARPWITACVPGANCWGTSVCISPRSCVWCVCVH